MPPPETVKQWDARWQRAAEWDGENDLSKTQYGFQLATNYQTTSNSSTAHQNQSISSSDQSFRHPYYDALALYQRAQISLTDQRLNALTNAQSIPNLATIFRNELAAIDADVYRLQIGYLNTLLLSPLPGIITAVYKYPGDAVKAGETVVRVENYAFILIEAVVIFRGPVIVNKSVVTIETALFGASSGALTSISGLVVAARGHPDGDDAWQLVVECYNMDKATPPQPIFPPAYRFAPDDTILTIG
jgi:biotin carboxyl carrier protein